MIAITICRLEHKIVGFAYRFRITNNRFVVLTNVTGENKRPDFTVFLVNIQFQ